MARHDAAKGTVAMPSTSSWTRNQGGLRTTYFMIALPEILVQQLSLRRKCGNNLEGPFAHLA